MNKIKLVKRSENVNYIYNESGEKTPQLNSVSYKVIDSESGNEIGSADCHGSGLSLSIYSGIQSIDDASAIIEKMFGTIAL